MKAVYVIVAIVAMFAFLSAPTWVRLVLGIPTLKNVVGVGFVDAVAKVRSNPALSESAVDAVVLREVRADATPEVTRMRRDAVVLFVDDRGMVRRSEFVAKGTDVRHDGVVI
jgi:hypothetical protein